MRSETVKATFESTVLCHVKLGNKECAQTCCVKSSRNIVYRTAEGVSVVSAVKCWLYLLHQMVNVLQVIAVN